MANFDLSIGVVLANEGGYVNNPADPGGETKYGISQRAYPDIAIAALTLDAAKQIYRHDYWQFDHVNSQAVATKLLDMSVNMGRVAGIKLLQRILRVTEDGIFGSHTLQSTNAFDPTTLLNELRVESAVHYAKVYATKPNDQFLVAWMRRACQ